MSQSGQTPNQNRIADLKVSGHLMTLDQGLFCVFHAPSQEAPGANGLPGVRITQPPLSNDHVSICSFDETGWLGSERNAALIRVTQGPAQVLVTIYQDLQSPHEAPRLQVVRLSDAGPAAAPVAAMTGAPQTAAPVPVAQPPAVAPAAAIPAGPDGERAEVAAHIQRRGDVGARLGEWMGTPGSRAWIEGFGIAPDTLIVPGDIEYQAVLGKGWLSPWAEGGHYCGSRGMALPILGLRVRLKGAAAEAYSCHVEATFTDGSKIGPVDDSVTVESESLAPLEAFRIILTPKVAEEIKVIQQLEQDLEEDLDLLEAAADLSVAKIVSNKGTRTSARKTAPAKTSLPAPKPARATAKAKAKTTPAPVPAPAKPAKTSRAAATKKKPTRR